MNPINAFKDGMLGKAGMFGQTKFFLEIEDSEKRFQESCLTQPIDWIYRTEQIVYQYNSHGHRCIEIDDLPKDYILFAGCSHTEGVAVKLENTYAYLVANQFNKAYYNIAVGGAGVDLVMINMLGFLSKAKVKPKLVIIQWPNFNRCFSVENTSYQFNVRFFTPADKTEFYHYLLKHNYPYNQSVLYRKTILDNLANYGINNIIENTEIYNIAKNEDYTVKASFGMQQLDKARDLCHGGNLTNKLWADSLIDAINKNFAHVI